jgi:hypothetical protein
MNLGAPELLVLLMLALPLIVNVWALIDAASTPRSRWEAADQNQLLWVILLVVGLFFCWLGVVLSIVYFATIRPKLRLTY